MADRAVPSPRPPPPRLRSLLWVLFALLVALALLGASMALLTTTERGSAWLLARIADVKTAEPRGRLFGGPFRAERIELEAGGRRIGLQRLAWRDARWTWRPHAGAWFGLAIDGLHIERVDVGPARPDPQAKSLPPSTLRLPFALALADARIGQVQVDGATVASELRTQLELGHTHGSQHRLTALSFVTTRGNVSGSASIGADAPFAVQARVQAASATGVAPRWQLQVQAGGRLAALELGAELGSPDATGARLAAQATLSPFAAWPLSALQASTQGLDLAALVAGAPQTALSGQAVVDTRGRDQPILARITLANARPGRWDEQRLPVSQLELELAGRADQPTVVTLRRFDIALPGNAGRASGAGEWRDDRATLELNLHAVRPGALDARAPAMTVGGALTTRIVGLPAPDGSRAAAPQLESQSTLALEGRFDRRRDQAARLSGRLEFDRGGDRWRAALNGLEARAGTARLTGQLQAERSPGGATTLALQGQAQAFDPALWWAELPKAQLHARWQAELQAPASALGGLPAQAAAWLALRGNGQLDVSPSSIAGVPLQGRARFDGRAPGWTLDTELRSGANRAQLTGRLAPRADDDRWRLDLEAPALASLRPAALALGGKAHFDGLEGTLAGQAQISGRWPALRHTGSARASGLRSGGTRIGRLEASWQAGPNQTAPLALTVTGDSLAFGGASLERLSARLDGSLAAHRLTLDATSGLRPPAWTEGLLGSVPAGAARGTRAQLRAEGRWQAAAGGAPLAGTLQARVAEIDARERSAVQPWLAARDLELSVGLDAQGRPILAQAAPGRLALLGAPLAWREARWQAATGQRPAQIALDAELAPMPIAPWLTRLRPDASVRGDLALKGRAKVQSGENFSADVVLERASGDLSLVDDGEAQPLGLTDLRLALAASNGTWHFTQAVAGSQMGVLAGAQSLRLAPAALWPAPDTPMQGVLEWRVADLGVWGRFTPPGWRVGGRLRTSAALGGRFGAPEIEGRMEGSGLAVRNLLQGVDLRDGELALSMRGEDARIERFVFKGGDGTLQLTGGARFGAEPTATLRLVADKFRVLGRADRRIVASGEAGLVLDAQSIALDGRFTVDEGLIDVSRGDAPSLDSDVNVRGGRYAVRQPDPALAAEPAPRPRNATPRNVRVAAALDLGPQLRLRGRGLDTRLAGRLAVSAPGGRLALNGEVQAVDGTYAAYGQKLEIERGVLRFGGETANPRLDILAVRPNLDVKVGVAVSGTALIPRVRLTSEPEMSEYDKLSWLVLGRASDGLGRADTALLQRAALALLAGEGGSPDTALLANLGLDELSVRQQANGEVSETVVTLGKQLSRRWFVGYERSITSTAGTWQLVYRAAQRFTLRAQSGAETALDAIWTWRWN